MQHESFHCDQKGAKGRGGIQSDRPDPQYQDPTDGIWALDNVQSTQESPQDAQKASMTHDALVEVT